MSRATGRLSFSRKDILVLSLVVIAVAAGSLYAYSLPPTDSGTEVADKVGVSLLGRIVAGSKEAAGSETVSLKDGETFKIVAEPVAKEVGGVRMLMYGYNGQIPGPLLRAKQGSSAKIEFENRLPFETTVHWHGLRLKNGFDGVPGLTQEPVKPGESFTYELDFPDAGPFWYHPHVREDLQQELGLYGGIIVEGGDDEADREEFLFLDDMLVVNGDVPGFFLDKVDFALMGRFGGNFLLNGREDYSLRVNRGERVRFLLTDSSGSRTYRFAIEGHELEVVGSDFGRFESPYSSESVDISPGERAVVDVVFGEPGAYGILHASPFGSYRLGEVVVEEDAAGPPAGAARGGGDILSGQEKSRYIAMQPDFSVELDMEMQGGAMGGMDHSMHGGMGGMMGEAVEGIEWEDSMQMMNVFSTDETVRWIIRDSVTGRENDGLEYEAEVGDTKKLRIFNRPDSAHPMQHPVHLHGQRFLVLARDGTPNENLVWKDTVLVRQGETVDLLVEFTNPGRWAVHCHIPEHMESGMMSTFKVSQ